MKNFLIIAGVSAGVFVAGTLVVNKVPAIKSALS